MSEERKSALSQAERNALVDEIFRATHMKVAADDPVVVAALIQARMFRREGSDVIKEIERVTQELPRQAEEVAARMSTILKQANDASRVYQAGLNEFANDEARRVAEDIRAAVSGFLYTQLSEPLETIRRTNRSGFWRTLVISTTVAVISLGGTWFGVRHYAPEFYQGLLVAEAFNTTWNELTPAEQRHIQALFNQAQ